MPRALAILLLIAGLFAEAAPSMAQTPKLQLQIQPKVRVQPNVKPPGVKPPAMRPIIPPSVAARAIMNAVPGAKILKLRNLPTGDIVGTIRVRNQLRNIRVNGQTGAVRP